MSCGIPVVATRDGGIPEVLPDLAGIMVPPRDVPALTAALAESMSRDWPTAAITGHAGRFTWDDNITRLDGVLRASAGQGAPTRHDRAPARQSDVWGKGV